MASNLPAKRPKATPDSHWLVDESDLYKDKWEQARLLEKEQVLLNTENALKAGQLEWDAKKAKLEASIDMLRREIKFLKDKDYIEVK